MDLTVLNDHMQHHLGEVDKARYSIGKIEALASVKGRLAVSAFSADSSLVGTLMLDEQTSGELRELLVKWKEREEEALKVALNAMANKLDSLAAEASVAPLEKEVPLVDLAVSNEQPIQVEPSQGE